MSTLGSPPQLRRLAPDEGCGQGYCRSDDSQFTRDPPQKDDVVARDERAPQGDSVTRDPPRGEARKRP